MSYKTTDYHNATNLNEHFFRRLRGGISSWKSHVKQFSGTMKDYNNIESSQEMQRPYFYYENIVAHQKDYPNDL